MFGAFIIIIIMTVLVIGWMFIIMSNKSISSAIAIIGFFIILAVGSIILGLYKSDTEYKDRETNSVVYIHRE